MSTDERDMAIGKMARERTELRSQMAILSREIKDFGTPFRQAGDRFYQWYTADCQDLDAGLAALRDIDLRGGIERLRTIAGEYKILFARVEALTESLREAGI